MHLDICARTADVQIRAREIVERAFKGVAREIYVNAWNTGKEYAIVYPHGRRPFSVGLDMKNGRITA